jgi:hypothetical protein
MKNEMLPLLKKSLLSFSGAVAVALTLFSGAAQAITQLGQAPDPGLIVVRGNLEWVYAAPCAGESPSCGVVALSNGFGFATTDEWLESFKSISDISTAFSGLCASSYFSTLHDHCDYGDINGGYIWHSPFALNASSANLNFSETFLVRALVGGGPGNQVPEPGSLALIGLGLAGLVVIRKRQQA